MKFMGKFFIFSRFFRTALNNLNKRNITVTALLLEYRPAHLHLPWHFSFPDLTGWFISCFTKLVTSCLPDFHPVLPCCIGHLAELPWLSLQGGNPDESWVCLLPHLQMEGDQDPVQHHLKQEDIETHEYFITKWPSSANILIFSLVVSFVFTF